MRNEDICIDISKLTDDDIGMRVCYVPQQARNDDNNGWAGHRDSEWGEVSDWNDRFIHVCFDGETKTKSCNPKDLLPSTLSSYAKRELGAPINESEVI